MFKRYRKAAALGLFAALAVTGGVYAAGNWSTLPIVGQPSFCGSTVTGVVGGGGITGQGAPTTGGGSICGQTIPAGPLGLTDEELIPADTGLTGGAPPQTVAIPSGLVGSMNTKVNRIIGGDFATNLWQRGTTPLGFAAVSQNTGNTNGTALMAADRWYVFSSSASVTVSKQTGTTDTIPSAGLYASMRLQRQSGNTLTNQICTGQLLDKEASQALIGANGVLSFWALAGANYSPTANNLTVTVAYHTAADTTTSAQATFGQAGTNTGTFAAGTITGYTNAVAGVGALTTGSVASGQATIPISTTWTRYSVYAPIPTATTAGTAITGVGVTFCMTPVGTAGANDWFELEGVQLQAMPSTVAVNLPAGVIGFTGFERRHQVVEALLQYYYTWVVAEPASGIPVANGQVTTATNCNIVVPTPAVMRVAPTLATSNIVGGTTWFVATSNLAKNVTAIATSTANTPNVVNANVTMAATASSSGCALEGNGGGNLLIESSEP